LTNDRQDVHMEYKSSQVSAQSWYFNDLDDSRLNVVPPNRNNVSVDENNPNRVITGGGAGTDNGDIVTLFEIFTNTVYNETKIQQDHIKYKAQNAIMESTTDWTNFEVTLYAEFMAVNSNSEIAIFGRSGRHVKGRPCEGTFYRVAIKANGNISCDAKHWHPGGTEVLDSRGGSLGDLEMMRIGIKFIVFTNKDGKTVTIRVMVDMNASNTWTEMCYVIDNGTLGFSNSYLRCGDETTKVITWGGPIIGVEIRNFPENGIAIDKWSVREIDALAPKVTIPTPAAPIDEYYVRPPDTPPSTSLRTNTGDDWDDDLDYPLPPWGDPGDNTPP
jgi:hypothetical protein